MPNQPKTRARGVRINDELWELVVKLAEAEGISYSDVIRRALERYVHEEGK